MNTVRAMGLALPLLAISFASPADERSFPGIEKLMTEEEFSTAGLHKLSAEERALLNAWLIDYTIDEGPVMRRTNDEVIEAEKSIQIASQIKQPFNGWDGETVFYLENGQVWQQRLRGRYRHTADSTDMVISKNLFGFYQMAMTATGKTVGVSRVR